MRLYVFAIGGTGSRVLKAMLMQFAAGVLPLDPVTGKPMTDVSVVPIIIDPHVKNEAVQSTNKLLTRYRDIRRTLYGEVPTRKGFYGVKILTLKDTVSDRTNSNSYNISDSFIFNMPANVSSQRFREFIGLSDMEMPEEGRMLVKTIFSNEELATEMSEGFYGSPNIGTVALNVFKDSDAYKVIGQEFKENDRMFFIGSIFGGTGAAGLPMLVSSIRQDDKHDAMSNAYMGALIVMPYFSITIKEDSEIQENDFIIKTKTALKYYVDNLYPYLNCTYYVADDTENKPVPFENDPGKDNQKANKAHFVEVLGGMSIINFLNQKSKDGKQNIIVTPLRKEAAEPKRYMQFQLKEDEKLFGFPELGKEVNSQFFIPMASFHFLMRFITSNQFAKNISQTFAKGRGIDEGAVTDDMTRFFNAYCEWLDQLSNHGDTAHNFIPFVPPVSATDYSNEIFGVPMKKRALGGTKKFEVSDLIDRLNKSGAHAKEQMPSGKLFMMVNDAMEKLSRNSLTSPISFLDIVTYEYVIQLRCPR